MLYPTQTRFKFYYGNGNQNFITEPVNFDLYSSLMSADSLLSMKFSNDIEFIKFSILFKYCWDMWYLMSNRKWKLIYDRTCDRSINKSFKPLTLVTKTKSLLTPKRYIAGVI